MEYIKKLERQDGVDIGFHDEIHKHGHDKNISLEQIVKIAYNMDEKPNIIIKAGKNAKWYLKKCPRDDITNKINKQKWRDTSRCTMYVIEWI
jgi:hypothetical protein